MSEINKGGTAFPAIKIVAGDNYNPPKQYHMPGMSLRDYFAAAALQGLLSCESVQGTPMEFAERTYEVADAMIAERSK